MNEMKAGFVVTHANMLEDVLKAMLTCTEVTISFAEMQCPQHAWDAFSERLKVSKCVTSITCDNSSEACGFAIANALAENKSVKTLHMHRSSLKVVQALVEALKTNDVLKLLFHALGEQEAVVLVE